jgi:hypothetical protein
MPFLFGTIPYNLCDQILFDTKDYSPYTSIEKKELNISKRKEIEMISKHIKGRFFIGIVFCVILGSLCGGCSSSGTDTVSIPCTTCKTFVTNATFDGNILVAGSHATAIANADALCMADINKPAGGGVYKALLVDGTNRCACTTTRCGGGTSEHIDWVLKPNTTYYRSNGSTLVFTTNANGIFDFHTDSIPTDISNSFDTSASEYWTGVDWPWVVVAGQECGGDWSSSSSSLNGDFGNGNRTDAGAIGGGAEGCNHTHSLLCVEQ